MLRIWFTVLLWLLASHGTHGYLSFSDVRTILEEKVSVASMPTDIRPQNVQSIPTWEHWMFFFIQDFTVHDIENKFEVNTLLTYRWHDETISWNKSLFSIEEVEMKRFSVWNPTILLRNTIGEKSYLGNFSHTFLISYYIIYQYIFGVVVITVTTILLRTVHSNDCKDIPPKCLTISSPVK